MAPVIQESKPKAEQPAVSRPTGSQSGSASQPRSSGASTSGGPRERSKDLFVRVKYGNTLPDIPFDAKFLIYPFDTNRFVEYKPTSLERNYKHEVLTEHDLGVVIDLINPETYDTIGLPHIHPDDDRLLEDEEGKGGLGVDAKRSRHHNKIVPWLKKTEYISTEFNRYGASGEKSETKVGYNIRKKMDEALLMDRDAQISAIDKTFVEATKPIIAHHSKPGLTPVEVMPVFPDFENWKYSFAQVTFDSDPLQSNEFQHRRMTEAFLRGVMEASGQQLVAYFLKDQEDELTYKAVGEFTWKVRNFSSGTQETSHFFVFRDGCAFFNELINKVHLTRRRLKAGETSSHISDSILSVSYRELNEDEKRALDERQSNIQLPVEGDADADMEMEPDMEMAGVKQEVKQEIKQELKQELKQEMSPDSDDSDE